MGEEERRRRRRRMTVEEPSPQKGGEVNMVTAYGPKLEDHSIDKGLDFDDTRGIQEMKRSCQTEDGCRVLKSTKTMEIFWYYKHFLDRWLMHGAAQVVDV